LSGHFSNPPCQDQALTEAAQFAQNDKGAVADTYKNSANG
jgi:hypothetical protein